MATENKPVEYTVLEKSSIDNKIHEAGSTVWYAGLPSGNLAPTCDVGHARHQEYLDSVKASAAAAKESGNVDHQSLARAVAAGMAAAFPNGMQKKPVDPETPIA